jgi:hypothetical protein
VHFPLAVGADRKFGHADAADLQPLGGVLAGLSAGGVAVFLKEVEGALPVPRHERLPTGIARLTEDSGGFELTEHPVPQCPHMDPVAIVEDPPSRGGTPDCLPAASHGERHEVD